MKLVSFYYQDLKQYWDNQKLSYVDREFDGPRGFLSLFQPILNKFFDGSSTIQQFIEPYTWHAAPTNLGPTRQELDEIASRLQNAELWIQATMYLLDEQATTFKGVWVQFDDISVVNEIWDQIQDYGFKLNKLPYIASVEIALK